jgi:hypothetical protein
LQPLANVNVKKASGLAFVPGGVLYVASRTAEKATKQNARIYAYTGVPENPGPGSSFDVQVGDLPEFVLHVPDAP